MKKYAFVCFYQWYECLDLHRVYLDEAKAKRWARAQNKAHKTLNYHYERVELK